MGGQSPLPEGSSEISEIVKKSARRYGILGDIRTAVVSVVVLVVTSLVVQVFTDPKAEKQQAEDFKADVVEFRNEAAADRQALGASADNLRAAMHLTDQEVGSRNEPNSVARVFPIDEAGIGTRYAAYRRAIDDVERLLRANSKLFPNLSNFHEAHRNLLNLSEGEVNCLIDHPSMNVSLRQASVRYRCGSSPSVYYQLLDQNYRLRVCEDVTLDYLYDASGQLRFEAEQAMDKADGTINPFALLYRFFVRVQEKFRRNPNWVALNGELAFACQTNVSAAHHTGFPTSLKIMRRPIPRLQIASSTAAAQPVTVAKASDSPPAIDDSGPLASAGTNPEHLPPRRYQCVGPLGFVDDYDAPLPDNVANDPNEHCRVEEYGFPPIYSVLPDSTDE